MNKKLILIGGMPMLLDRALAMGCDVFAIQKPSLLPNRFSKQPHTLVVLDYEANIDSVLGMLSGIHQMWPFDACVTTTESGLLLASRIQSKLGLKGNCIEVVRRICDKSLMRQHLCSSGFSPVNFQVVLNLNDAEDFAKNVGYPLIAKPIAESGSLGVCRIEDQGQLHQLNFAKPILLEEYLDGEEYSIEAFSVAGYHHILAITAKFLNSTGQGSPFVEVGHAIPASLSTNKRTEVECFIQDFLTIMKIEHGPTHTEIKSTKKGLRVIETHNRVGGGAIPDLLQLVTGLDLYQLTLDYYLGQEVKIGELNFHQAASIRFFEIPNGTIKSIAGIEAIRNHPNIHRVELSVSQGSKTKTLFSSDDRSGYVISTGQTIQEAIQFADWARRMITFEFEFNESI